MSADVFYNQSNELATVSNTFAVNSVPADPTTVSLVVTDPDGTTNTYTYPATITKDSTGVYHKDVDCSSTQRGIWQAVWIGTGTASDVQPVSWTTYSTILQALYCTPAELKSRLGGISNTDDDTEILQACTAVSRWIDKHCRRVFYRQTATSTFEPEGLYCLRVPDLVSITSLKTDATGDGVYETTWSSSDYQLLPADAASEFEPEPYTEIRAVSSQTFPIIWDYIPNTRRNRVQITGVWGWPAIPEAVKQAAAILAEDTYKLKDAPFGVAGEGEFTVRVGDNRRAMAFLAPYRRMPVLVG